MNADDLDVRMLIDGRMVAGEESIPVINPATGRIFAAAPDASRAQLDEAVAAARTAFPAWAALDPSARAEKLQAVGRVVADNADTLKFLLTREQGKPLADAYWELMGCSLWCEGTSALVLPSLVTEDSADRFSETHHLPLGVVGGIVPWNFPLLLAFWKIAPALLAGNTMVLKPAPTTPLTVLKLGELLVDVLPRGVLNIVSGGDQLGPWMTAHSGIDKISFTGSTRTGQAIMAASAASLKHITLELGGNDPAIVMPDVDVDAAARDLFWAAFKNSGQICVATKRLYVHEKIYADFTAALVSYAKTIPMGDGTAADVQLGPVQNKQQFDRVCALIEDARARGHRFLCGGAIDKGQGGYFIPATIVDDVADDAPVVTEEAFGPLLPVLRFNDREDVIRRANAGPYGLAASIWSRDIASAKHIASRLDCGTVWINEVQHATPFAPFAGHKQSGIGAENGMLGLLAYTQPRTVHLKR